jgi:hypothetical protein
MRKSELLCPEFVMDSAAVEESLWILLQSILADATIDSPRRINYRIIFTRGNSNQPCRVSKNLRFFSHLIPLGFDERGFSNPSASFLQNEAPHEGP